jgi:cytochrome c-type biogenesis protein CcmH
MSRRTLSWLLMAVVAVVALAFGTVDDGGPRTAAERARDVASTIRCPTCRSQSAADSDAPAARAIRTEIARRVGDGQSDDEIRAYFASRFGEEVLLTPERSGLGGIVWVLPVALGVCSVAAVLTVLRGASRERARGEVLSAGGAE